MNYGNPNESETAAAGISARALAHEVDPATLAASLGAERNSLWILLAVATANVIFGIWRPRLSRLRN